MRLKSAQEALVAYLATLAAIVMLTGMAVVAILFAPLPGGEDIARLATAIGFVAAAVTGLVGVIGTFRPKGSPEGSPGIGDSEGA